MQQATPKQFGQVLWRGGQGRPGEMGGWGYRCNFCQAGDRLSAMPRKKTADANLFSHVISTHPLRLVEVGSTQLTVRDLVASLTTTTRDVS